MNSALEEIEFLALSSNRVEVLSVLSEDPHTRQEIEQQTDASQPTIGRVLRDLTDRQWIAYDGQRYAATATGELVAEEFTDLWETMEVELKLRDVVEWLPTDAIEFDLRNLSDATITTPSQTRPGAPVQRVLELLRQANHVRILSHALNEQSLNVIHQRIGDEAQTFKGVLSSSAVEAIAADSALRQQLEELLASEAAELRRYDGEIPFAVTITDEVVHLLLRDDNDLLRAAIDTDDETVLSWARERHEHYWQNSSAIDSESIVR